MSVTLAELLTRLQAEVPARSGVPSETQYTQAIEDAVADYSRRKPLEKVTTLSIVSGTADYTLPTGFLYVIHFETLWAEDGVLNTTDGLIPVSAAYEEYFTIAGLTLTLHPTPTYTTTRDLRYAAGHVLTSSAYPDMTDDDARILLLYAQALCLRSQARAAATASGGEIVEYQIGDERVKRSASSDTLRSTAADVEAEYERRVTKAIGSTGLRASYNWMGQ